MVAILLTGPFRPSTAGVDGGPCVREREKDRRREGYARIALLKTCKQKTELEIKEKERERE